MTDNSLMPFGAHKNKKLANVPADYLLWLYEKNIAKGELRFYIIANMDVLKAEAKALKCN